ncbi:hypothetical protein [Achromobacter insolitus]|uniref:hypothetical protein n=1 Tax=Achromobacter insolitus TaxID=217204 RepID=UPI0028A9B8A5|nr:hypothetical protein [Achromobacter insolitus]
MTPEQMQLKMHEVLARNLGNRLTPDLINGLAASLSLIAREGIQARAAAEAVQTTPVGT